MEQLSVRRVLRQAWELDDVAKAACSDLGTAMQEAARGFRRLKAHKQLPTFRAALEAQHNKDSHGFLARHEDGPVITETVGEKVYRRLRGDIISGASRRRKSSCLTH